MELALDGREIARQDGLSKVSILVFVELALDARPEDPAIRRAASFNPCFRGTCS